MSNEFKLLNYLNPKPDGLRRKLDTLPFVLPSLNQNTGFDFTQETLDKVLHRHLRPISTTSTIQVRQVRHIPGPLDTTGWLMGDRREENNDFSSEIAVRAVRPYARKSRTSSYWQDSGWEKRGDHLIGHYAVGQRMFPGSIELRDSVVEPAMYYIYNPPSAVLDGPHGVCFRFQGKASDTRKYWIHFSEEPSDVDSGIIQIERDLSAAIGA